MLKTVTGTDLPYVRADWFAFTAARPGLYDKLLGLPKTFQGLAKDQGVDLEANIKSFHVARAGFAKSGVSQNNRLIERHASKTGYFWTSYDFAGTGGKKSLFEHPLGPKGENAFEHDGGETIYSLPNGFQAYYLNKANGEALKQGPTNIVRDPSRRDLAVTNGISCMGCHDQGMRKAKDDIRALVLEGRLFSKEVKDTVEAMYPPHDKMDAMIDGDAKRFAAAMAAAGLDPTLKLNGVEMINALSDRFEANVDLIGAAAEFGLSRSAFEKVADDANRKSKLIIRRLVQGSVPREEFEARFAELAAEVTDDKVVKVAAVDGKPTEIAKAETAAADRLTLVSDKSIYAINEVPVFTVVSTKDCFLTVSNTDEKGKGETLLPNGFQSNHFIKANVPFKLPDAKYSFRLNRKGFETVIAVCNDKPVEVDGIKHNFTRSVLTPVESYTEGVFRSIEQRKITVTPNQKSGVYKPSASDDAKVTITDPKTGKVETIETKKLVEAARETTRAAIVVEVR